MAEIVVVSISKTANITRRMLAPSRDRLVRPGISGQYSFEMTRDTFLASGACAVLLAAAGGMPTAPPAPAKSAETSTIDTPKPAMPSDPYLAEVTKFRQDREATLKGDAGWLTIAGLWFLTQPLATFGSDPLNDIVFPASAPPRAGIFELKDGKVTVKAADGVTFHLEGKPLTTAELKGDVPGPADRVSLGDDLQF